MKGEKAIRALLISIVLLLVIVYSAVQLYANRFSVSVYYPNGTMAEQLKNGFEKARIVFAVRWTEKHIEGIEREYALWIPQGANSIGIEEKRTQEKKNVTIGNRNLLTVDENQRLLFYDAPKWVRKWIDLLFRRVNPTYNEEVPETAI